ncbi:DUF1643 domain-containing protein [Leucobacter sp. cx-169]|uniref:DUF1643 domain-containing protein n=1 Tax=unclassified Leucobacter TaxID=2621730 RepID=UPI00351C7912
MLYANTPDDSARFLLGTVGTNPLVCMGVNPSTATPEKLDRTVTRVARYAELNDHDSLGDAKPLPAAVNRPHRDGRRARSGAESSE